MNKQANKFTIWIITALIILLLFVKISIRFSKGNEQTILLGYRDTVMGVSEIVFKDKNRFSYILSGLFYEDEYIGKYKIANDTIHVEFNNQKPKTTFSKIVIKEKDRSLIVMNSNDSVTSKLYIESKYLSNINRLLEQ